MRVSYGHIFTGTGIVEDSGHHTTGTEGFPDIPVVADVPTAFKEVAVLRWRIILPGRFISSFCKIIIIVQDLPASDSLYFLFSLAI